MKRKIVAIIGISGVGKTTLLKSYVRKHRSVVTISASGLLKRRLSLTDPEKLRTATSATIQSNQDRLVQAFGDFKSSTPNTHILFDGHAIIDNDESIVTIPTEIYRALAPDLIIFVVDDPNLIALRRDADSKRQRPSRSPQELEQHQELARKTTYDYGHSLSVPCSTIKSSDVIAFGALLDQFFK